jgi:hypothetical protein
MIRITRSDGRVFVQMFCDHCGEIITDPAMAILVSRDEAGTAAALHKMPCARQFEAAHPASRYGCFTLDHAVVVLAGGLGIGVPEFQATVQRCADMDPFWGC